MYMKSLLYLLPIGPTDPLFKIHKQLWISYPGGSYGMIKARVLASFKQISALGFGGNLESVLNF